MAGGTVQPRTALRGGRRVSRMLLAEGNIQHPMLSLLSENIAKGRLWRACVVNNEAKDAVMLMTAKGSAHQLS